MAKIKITFREVTAELADKLFKAKQALSEVGIYIEDEVTDYASQIKRWSIDPNNVFDNVDLFTELEDTDFDENNNLIVDQEDVDEEEKEPYDEGDYDRDDEDSDGNVE